MLPPHVRRGDPVPGCRSSSLGGLTVAAAALVGMLLLAGCGGTASDDGGTGASLDPDSRLHARPSAGGRSCRAGVHELRVDGGRRALMRVAPGGLSRAHPFLLALHGANSGGAPGGLWAFRGAWKLPGLVIVAPSAAGSTWTLGRTDIALVDRALRFAFRRCAVDRRRVGVGGFSAGAGLRPLAGAHERRPLPLRDRALGGRLASDRPHRSAGGLPRARDAGLGHPDRGRRRRARPPAALRGLRRHLSPLSRWTSRRPGDRARRGASGPVRALARTYVSTG